MIPIELIHAIDLQNDCKNIVDFEYAYILYFCTYTIFEYNPVCNVQVRNKNQEHLSSFQRKLRLVFKCNKTT